MRKPKELHNFYKSKQWYIARTLKTQNAKGRCERCGSIGEEVHHKIRLTVDNVKDALISLNQDNLELLCKSCHNKEHGRFKTRRKTFDKDANYLE